MENKAYKAGFVLSDSNIRPDQTLKDVIELKEKTGHSTVAVTEDGTPEGKLLGIVTSRDYRISRMSLDEKVETFMTPLSKLVTAPEGTSLKTANDIIWDNKLNSLPIVNSDGKLCYLVYILHLFLFDRFKSKETNFFEKIIFSSNFEPGNSLFVIFSMKTLF